MEGEPWWQAAFSFVFSNLVHGMETHSPWALLSQLNLSGGMVIDIETHRRVSMVIINLFRLTVKTNHLRL